MALTELECPRCATVAINRDFCSCGEYLGWELTTADVDTPVTAPAAYRPPTPPVARAATLLTLRDPARESDDAGATVAVPVAPGETVTVLATIRNQGDIVDAFDVRLEGLPDAWWTLSAPTVFLNPWGSSGDYEQEVQVRLHPPRTPESEARDWPLTVVARSRSLHADVASAAATLTVEPFQSTVMRAGPERRQGRRHGRFVVAVDNHGNAPAEILIAASDGEARCPVSVAPARVTVPIGATATALVLVGAPRPLWFKQPIDHRVDVAHRADGIDLAPQRVTFRQQPWLPWWLPPALVLLAAFVTAILLLRRDPEVPKLEGDTVAAATAVLERHGLRLGRTTYVTAPRGVPVNTVVAQQPAAGDEIVDGEAVHLTLAAAAQTGKVPAVHGLTLAQAATSLKTARFAHDPQPSTAGDDWVVIRQDPTPGTAHEVGKPVTLAVEKRTAAASAAPVVPAAPATATPTPDATPEIDAGAPPASAPPASTPTPKATAEPASARTAAKAPAPPADLVFAGATSGQLYRWADAKTTRLTAPRYRFETPTRTDDGFAAVQISDDTRRLVTLSGDGKTVTPLADGSFHRPAYSPVRGLLAVIARDGDRGPRDAGRLCVIDPTEASAPACASTGPAVGRPAWAPDGRSVLVLAARRGRHYDELRSATAYGGDASRWKTPKPVYRAAGIRSAAWIGDDRVAVLVADRRNGEAHLRLLARGASGRFTAVKDFPDLTGHELAASGPYLALRHGDDASGDGPMLLLDTRRTRPRVGSLPHGVNPVWVR